MAIASGEHFYNVCEWKYAKKLMERHECELDILKACGGKLNDLMDSQ